MPHRGKRDLRREKEDFYDRDLIRAARVIRNYEYVVEGEGVARGRVDPGRGSRVYPPTSFAVSIWAFCRRPE